MIDLSRGPFPITYREFWLPRGINENASLPSSRYNGHGLTFTGARRGTTCDGVHFDGSVGCQINCGIIHNAAAKLWVSLRFKFDQDFSPGVGYDCTLFVKLIDAANKLEIYASQISGRIHWRLNGAGAFNIQSSQTSWEAGRWYHALGSLSDVNGARFIIDNGTPITDPALGAAPNGGTVYLGGAGYGQHRGVIADVFLGTDDLTAAEEVELYRGFPPADVVNEWLLDEGRGLTAYDRGSGGNNGTLATSCSWAYGTCKHPVISFDSINDLAASAAAVIISGDLTLVWVGKMKSTYNGVGRNISFIDITIDANNRLWLGYQTASNEIQWYKAGPGTDGGPTYLMTSGPISIDDYVIFVGTVRGLNQLFLYFNGSLIDSWAGGGALPGAGATARLGDHYGLTTKDISKPLLVGLFDTAFTQEQALAYSHWLNEFLNLGIGI